MPAPGYNGCDIMPKLVKGLSSHSWKSQDVQSEQYLNGDTSRKQQVVNLDENHPKGMNCCELFRVLGM